MPSFLPVTSLTLRDLARRRVFVTLGLFAALMILLSFPLRQLTVGQWQRLITDVGFGSTDLCVTLLGIFLGATLVSGDLDRRTLYPLLSRPIGRASFVAGKFAGLALMLSLLVTAMTLGIVAILLLAHQPIAGQSLAQTAIAMTIHAFVCGGLALMFSCFSSTTLAAILGLSLAFLGHMVDNLIYFASKSEGLPSTLILAAAKLLPNLEKLNFKTLAAHSQVVPWSDLGMRVGYGLAYSIAAVSLGSAIFARRDLK